MLRPDAIIHLPQKRDVVVDAKLALVDYNNAVGATTSQERDKFLKAQYPSYTQAHQRAWRKISQFERNTELRRDAYVRSYRKRPCRRATRGQ